MEEVEERWVVIEGFPKYEVSDLGRVRNKGNHLVLQPYETNGYKMVSLRNHGRNNRQKVHRLVAKAFVHNPDPENKPEVNHLNGKEDNRACSLAWVDGKENMQHYYATRTEPKPSRQAVRVSDGVISEDYPSIYSCAKAFGLRPSTIWSYLYNGRFRNLTIEKI